MYDLIVIGGGVNGTGIARDAAQRGYRTLLLEKRDVAAGSSGANSGMIHGGVRYLRYDRSVTELACIDSGYIQRIAPHLLFRIPFLFPIHARDPQHPGLVERGLRYGVEVYLGMYDDLPAAQARQAERGAHRGGGLRARALAGAGPDRRGQLRRVGDRPLPALHREHGLRQEPRRDVLTYARVIGFSARASTARSPASRSGTSAPARPALHRRQGDLQRLRPLVPASGGAGRRRGADASGQGRAPHPRPAASRTTASSATTIDGRADLRDAARADLDHRHHRRRLLRRSRRPRG